MLSPLDILLKGNDSSHVHLYHRSVNKWGSDTTARGTRQIITASA